MKKKTYEVGKLYNFPNEDDDMIMLITKVEYGYDPNVGKSGTLYYYRFIDELDRPDGERNIYDFEMETELEEVNGC